MLRPPSFGDPSAECLLVFGAHTRRFHKDIFPKEEVLVVYVRRFLVFAGLQVLTGAAGFLGS